MCVCVMQDLPGVHSMVRLGLYAGSGHVYFIALKELLILSENRALENPKAATPPRSHMFLLDSM